jgi:hypothetical protein
MRKTDAFRRAAALMAALSITVSLAAPAFAGTYYIDDGDITITKMDDGSQKIEQNGAQVGMDAAGDETIITTHKKAITSLESDLEGPAAEDSGFGPVVEDNYQPAAPAQPKDAEEPKDADQPESAEEPKSVDQPENTDRQEDADQQEDAEEPESAEEPEDADRKESADRQAQPQQAALTAADDPATSTPANGFWGNTITVINKVANTVLNLTLRDVKIDVSDNRTYGDETGKAALSVQGKGSVEIELDGKNELKSGYKRAGLEKTSEGTLTLKDDKKKAGSLTATGGKFGAGIGGGNGGSGKNITITGGTVNAKGGLEGAGIGGGTGGSGEAITINGGTVEATGGKFGAGIGGGLNGVGKNITIKGGTVNAAGGDNGGAGIGGGDSGSGEAITINGGTVNAAGGGQGAGIGGGNYGSGEAITINGGTVEATGGDFGAGIGGGSWGNGEDITIKGGTVEANGGLFGAGIGGGSAASIGGSGKNITITGGTVKAAGGERGAGIGGGSWGSGSNVTVSGAAQVTAIAGKPDRNGVGAGATIGNGDSMTEDGEIVDGKKIQADISGLTTTGYIRHMIYNEDDSVKQEWWEYGHLQPAPDTPNAPAEESNEVDLGTPGLHVETLEGDLLPFDAQQQGSTLRVTSDNLAARLHGTRQALEALREQGVEQIQFVTSFKTTTLPVAELLAEGGSWFALEHNGLVSRQLSAAQAESLKCQMR